MSRLLRRRSEHGVTLVELLVVMTLMSIVGAITFSVLVDTTQLAGRANNSTSAENNARLALRTMSQDLRAAEQIRTSSSTTACPTGATFPAGFANCIAFLVPHDLTANATTTTIAPGAGPIQCPFSKITYGLRSGVILEDRTDYNASCQQTQQSAGKPVLRGIDNTSSQPLFTYYDSFGNQLGTANSIADYTNAGSIAVQVALTYQKGAPDISLMTMAALRNNR
jgi:prepilin-type N-terminal cleavage/methylation domain-containing protein